MQWRHVTARQGVRDFPFLADFRAFARKSTKACVENIWSNQFSREWAKISEKVSRAHPEERSLSGIQPHMEEASAGLPELSIPFIYIIPWLNKALMLISCLKFIMELQLNTDYTSWSRSKFWYFEKLQLDMVFKRRQIWLADLLPPALL